MKYQSLLIGSVIAATFVVAAQLATAQPITASSIESHIKTKVAEKCKGFVYPEIKYANDGKTFTVAIRQQEITCKKERDNQQFAKSLDKVRVLASDLKCDGVNAESYTPNNSTLTVQAATITCPILDGNALSEALRKLNGLF